MRCPQCSSVDNKVLESRYNQVADVTRRRRECLQCQARFTTHERLENSMPAVVKKDSRREEFDRQKLFGGIQKACQKRPINANQIEKIVTEIEKLVVNENSDEIQSKTLGHLVMRALHDLDKVAYIRFASVYREFKDVETFVSELQVHSEKKDSERVGSA